MYVTVSNLAEADLEAITDFIANDNPLRAASYARELLKACLALADTPFRFAQLENYEALGYQGAYTKAIRSSIELRAKRSQSSESFPATWTWTLRWGETERYDKPFRRPWNKIAPISNTTIASEISAL